MHIVKVYYDIGNNEVAEKNWKYQILMFTILEPKV